MEDEQQQRQQVGLFRYGVISDLVHLAPGTRGLQAKLVEKSGIDYRIPGSRRSRVAAETIRDWLKRYRKSGFEALLPRSRSDTGRSRAVPQEVADLLAEIKEEHRDWSVSMVIDEAGRDGKLGELSLAPSTVIGCSRRAD